jgi:hypothetical protein
MFQNYEFLNFQSEQNAVKIPNSKGPDPGPGPGPIPKVVWKTPGVVFALSVITQISYSLGYNLNIY